MFRDYFIFIFLGYILGEFYVQTKQISHKEEKSLKWVIIHCICYLATMMLITIPIISWKVILFNIIIVVIHFIIDVIKYEITSKIKITICKERNIFFITQMLHITCLVIIAYLFVISGGVINLHYGILEFFNVIGIPEIKFFSWIAALAIIHKPVNITISKLVKIYKPDDDAQERKRDKNAGRFIGTIERIIILIFISIGQYSAIGLVLTAKSIARYDRIAKEKDFAEYYLLGTLISTAAAILCSYII